MFSWIKNNLWFVLATPKCSENEYYSECGDDGCQRICPQRDSWKINQNHLQTKGNKHECTPICSIAACICKPGFVRNLDGECIPPNKCRKDVFFQI